MLHLQANGQRTDRASHAMWNRLLQSGYEKILDPEDLSGNVIPLSEWFDDWIQTDGASDETLTPSPSSVSEVDGVDEVPGPMPPNNN